MPQSARLVFSERRARDRRQQQDDAEIRVRARPPRRGLDGQPHRRADAARAGAGQRLADRRRAGEEVLVARVGEMAARRHVPRLRRARPRAGTRAAPRGHDGRGRSPRARPGARPWQACMPATCARALSASSATRSDAARRTHALGQVVHDGPCHVDARRLLQPLPAGNAVHLEHEDRAVARGQQIHARVIGADRRRRPQGQLLP